MKPFDFLAYTPKTNCGECGHPTCLAFSVAVINGGVDPTLCPYLDLANLPPELSGQKVDAKAGLERVDQGQEQRDLVLIEHLKSKIQDADLAVIAENIGAKWSLAEPDQLFYSYIGRQAMVGKKAVSMEGEPLVDPRDQILLYNYVAFAGGKIPEGPWIGMESLPNSISKVRTLATYCEQRIAERFCGRPDVLQSFGQDIGGKDESDNHSATVALLIPVLPRVPLLLLFWDEEPEDGFEAKVKILFDQNVLDFLDLESLVFAAERLSDRFFELDQI